MSIISDVATLVKAGFTIDDIKEIVKADKAPAGDTITPPAKAPEAPEDKKGTDPEDKKGTEPDYKALYEKAQDDLKKAQDDLKKAQAANTKEDIEQPPVDREELFKSIKNRL